MPAAKINWNLFFKESSGLICHTLLFGFYLRIAQVLFEYYKTPALASFFLFVSLCFALPLTVNFLDLWARIIASVRETAIAERVFNFSILLQKKIFGSKNANLSEKQASLAHLYYEQNRTEEAEKLFAESWNNYTAAPLKFPFLHRAFADYLKILSTSGDTDLAKRIQSALSYSLRMDKAQKLLILTMTFPILFFMWFNQATERYIAKQNANGKIVDALKAVSELANREALILGPYAAAKVYKDYAVAFEDSGPQISEMSWCVDKALLELDKTKLKDDYLKVSLLNMKAKALLAEDKNEKALESLKQAVQISSAWGAKELKEHHADAKYERDNAYTKLADLYRGEGQYALAEPLYMRLLNYSGKEDANQILQDSDPVETIDRLHKLQHVEERLSNRNEVLKLQKLICEILENSVARLAKSNMNSSVCDFGVREASRALEVCSILSQDAGNTSDAAEYHRRAENLRKLHQKALRLDALQQDKVVDASIRITNDLLSVKYRAGNWQESLNKLLAEDLKSKRARGAFERLPWFDSSFVKTAKLERNKRAARTLEVDIAPLNIRNSREGDGIAVDVSGTVKILGQNKKDFDEQRFAFGYVLKSQNSGRPVLDDLLDNQLIGRFQLD